MLQDGHHVQPTRIRLTSGCGAILKITVLPINPINIDRTKIYRKVFVIHSDVLPSAITSVESHLSQGRLKARSNWAQGLKYNWASSRSRLSLNKDILRIISEVNCYSRRQSHPGVKRNSATALCLGYMGIYLRLFHQILLEYLLAYRLEERSFSFFLIHLARVKRTAFSSLSGEWKLLSLLVGPQTHYHLYRSVQGFTLQDDLLISGCILRKTENFGQYDN
ncbi:hypothetical protein TNCV_814141 [Trichonephila clavipes]|nr:hypothetical protein TNCV_814141 [Trichonephila clavipes]